MTLQKFYPTPVSQSNTLTLDTLANAVFFFSGRWQPELKRNQSRDALRLIVNKLYGASHGSMFHARMRCSHAALADSLNLSREWTCKLIARLRDAGWIATEAPRLPDGKQEVTIFRTGPMLKRLLVMLLKSRQKGRVNDRSQKIPSKQDIEKGKAFFAELRDTLSKKLGMKT